MDTRNLTQNVLLTCTRNGLSDDVGISLILPALWPLRDWPHRNEMLPAMQLTAHAITSVLLEMSQICREYSTKHAIRPPAALLGLILELFQSGQCVSVDNEIDGALHS